ncbi:hypothetical protein Daus18300_001239 [Diaporthe australafricana]|uniref:Uncharacterized protein n=1 Tax=Diaporthe australafricana TaxID=127596 RepID=A0ABR3XX96_9PEZI
MDLDDTAQLIADAQAKLAELDGRVAAYRLQMATEFNRFSEELLQNVPEDAAYRVSQAVAESLVNYPHLFPPGGQHRHTSPLESPTEIQDSPWRNKGSPPPILPHTSGTPKEPIRSTHERELEFQGLFTPTYLPLLDSTDRPLHSPPTSPGAGPHPNIDSRLAVRNTQTSEGTQTSEAPPPPEETQVPAPAPTSEGTQTTGSPHHRPRPTPRPSPLRRATDASIESIASDSSSVTTRKSALRRSSASSSRAADSPRETRRVRFEVQGQEVLPSSSPQASTAVLADVVSASSESPAVIADASLPVTSLGDIDGEEDPPPRKVSSSQALRALSKAPLDDPSTWTVVNAGSEDSASDADKTSSKTATAQSLEGEDRDKMPPKQLPIHVKPESGGGRDQGQVRDGVGHAESETMFEVVQQAEDESSEDEDPLMIMSKKDFKKKLRATKSQASKATDAVSAQPKGHGHKSTPPINNEPVTAQSSAAKVAPTKQAQVAEDEDDDDMFKLEAGDNDETLEKAISARGSPQKHLPEDEPEEDDKAVENSDEEEADDHEAQFKPNAPIQASPPIGMAIKKTTDIPAKVPPMPQGSIAKMSIGSYGGKPITMAPVKDKELMEKIAKSEDARPFFVGSVNGRSGPDPSNAKSYRASLPSPARSGPGTFMERWMREKEDGTKYASDKEDDQNEKKE